MKGQKVHESYTEGNKHLSGSYPLIKRELNLYA